LAEEWHIGACVNVIQKYCDTSLFEGPLLEEAFKDLGIPYLTLEIDDTSPGLRQIETRVQAFLEMIGGF
jgi:benzoyl-CoA reductase/2-hydroxyglutaryl-CoA dehydratase subunit BcrC/BadD/HgdB